MSEGRWPVQFKQQIERGLINMSKHRRRTLPIRMHYLVSVAIRLAILLLAATGMRAAHAACAFASGFSFQTMNLTVPNISVPRDAEVGTVLATVQLASVPGEFASCTDPGNAYFTFYGGTAASSSSDTVNTNVPGIGLRFFLFSNNSLSFRFSAAGSPPFGSYVGNWNWNVFGTGYFGVKVVVTGPINAGQVNGTHYATVTLDSLPVTRINVSSFAVTVLSCTTPNVTVDLGPVRQSAFKGVGTTAGKKSFAIKLNNCPSGIDTVSYRIDPSTSILDAKNSVIALNPKGATGVGVQLMDSSGNPLPLQTAIKTGYAPNAASFSIPLQAAYYQTGTTITPGPANSGATFTMTYQ